jgi:hypothetical protein
MAKPSKPTPPAVPPRVTPKVTVIKEGGSGGRKA